MSKSARWTIYVAIIIGVLVFGWYTTFTKSPDEYVPRDIPPYLEEELHAAEHDRPEPDREAEGVEEQIRAEAEEAWEIELSGTVEEVHRLQADDDPRAYLSVALSFDDDGDRQQPPAIDSPIRAIAPATFFEMHLERIPEPGDAVAVTSSGTEPAPAYLTIQAIELIGD